MGRKRLPINLTSKERFELNKLSKSRVNSINHVIRSQILLDLEKQHSYKLIAKNNKCSISVVRNCYKRYIYYNNNAIKALDDLKRSGRPPILDFTNQNILLNIACKKPRDLIEDYAGELWTQKYLAKYIRFKYCNVNGLSKINQSQISKLYSKRDIKPHKLTYYIHGRDINFDVEMKKIMEIYRDVELTRENPSNLITTIFADEKLLLEL